MFLVAFYGFFRVGELTAKGANSKLLVQIQDLHFQFKNECVTSATIVISDWRPFSVILVSAKGTEFCPVTYLQCYCAMRGTTPGALFCLVDRTPVKTGHFTQQLHQTLNSIHPNTSPTLSGSTPPLLRLKRDYQMLRFVTLAVGNPLLLSYTFVNLNKFAFQSRAGATMLFLVFVALLEL